MLFNSLEFAIFFPVVFFIYWFLKDNLKLQNALILSSSLIFYGWWDWRFLSLILISSILDYSVGIGMAKTQNNAYRRSLLILSICVNLGILFFFKYFNFFSDSFSFAFTLMGHPFEVTRLNVILPVGISFYTFQTMSYSIDVYRGVLQPTKDVVAFFAFVCFFPQLVAGPIERATNLLPQFSAKRNFDHEKSVDGMRQILWGLFKKIVIADNCAVYVKAIFANYQAYSGSTLFLGAVLFAFQIYGDFSGYSDIAVGSARLLNFDLKRNFAYPYFSRDIAEFWRRWHISLSSWFRDYVYIPLGGSRGSKWMQAKNTFIIFLLSGFWHGANWTFIVWGGLNALFFLPLLMSQKNRTYLNVVASDSYLPSLKETVQMMQTFCLTTIAWIFFRAESLEQAFNYLRRMLSSSLFSISVFDLKQLSVGADIVYVTALIVMMIAIEWLQRSKSHGLQFDGHTINRPIRWALYYAVIFLIIYSGGQQQDFIYFQF